MTVGTVGRWVIDVFFKSDKNSKKKVEDDVQDLAASAKKLLGAIGIGFSIKGTYEAIKSCVAVASSVEEMENKFNTVFKGINADVDAWAQNYADKINRNKNDIKSYLADQQNLLVGFGMTREAGADLSKQMTTLALDLASFANIDEANAVNAMTKAVMGESEAAKTLGAVLNDSTREQAMHALGLKGTYNSLDQLTKMQVNYQAILSQSPDAIGDCERSMGSYQSTLKGFNSKLNETKELVGNFFMPAAKRLLELGTLGVLKLRDVITKVQDFADRVGGANHLLALLAASAAAVFVVLNFGKIVKGANLLLGIIGKLDLRMIAIAAKIALLVLLVDDFINFMKGNDSVLGLMLEKAGIDADEFRGKIFKIWQDVKSVLLPLWKGFSSVFVELFGLLGDFWAEWGDDILAVLGQVANFIVSTLEKLFGLFSDGEKATGIMYSLGQAIGIVVAGIALAIPVISTLLGVVKAVSGAIAFFTSPVGIAVAAIAALIAIGVLLYKNWDKIKGYAVNLLNSLVETFENIKSSIQEKVTNIKDSIVHGFLAAVEWIKGLPAQAVQWGSDIIQGIVNGIKGAVGKVTDAVKGVAGKIKSFLHFSVPDEGPLTEYQKWMPDFMQGLADGINGHKDIVLGAIEKLAGDIGVNVNGDGEPKPRPNPYGATPRTAASAVSTRNSSKTIHQVNNFNNHFNGGEREMQKQLSKSAKAEAKDTSAELARALQFA